MRLILPSCCTLLHRCHLILNAAWQPGPAALPLNQTQTNSPACLDNPALHQVAAAEAALAPARGSRPEGSYGRIVDDTFGAVVSEEVQCGTCGKTTHQIAPRTEHCHPVSGAGGGVRRVTSADRGMQCDACGKPYQTCLLIIECCDSLLIQNPSKLTYARSTMSQRCASAARSTATQ